MMTTPDQGEYDFVFDAKVRSLVARGWERKTAEQMAHAALTRPRESDMGAPARRYASSDQGDAGIDDLASRVDELEKWGIQRINTDFKIDQIREADKFDSPLTVATMRGNYDSFPAVVSKVFYGGTPPVGVGGQRTQFVLLKRAGVLRDTTNNYTVSGAATTQGVDDSRSFMAQPLLGVDCPDYYVVAGDIVTAHMNRDPQGQHVFSRDEDPFVGQVTAVGAGDYANTVTVKRVMWTGDPDGGSYAGPTLTTFQNDADSSLVSYTKVLMEDSLISASNPCSIGDKVFVMRRGRHMVGRKPGAALPTGIIVMWSGAVGAIPGGWLLCDGTNGTPNLSGQFVAGYSGAGDYTNIGGTGGFATHGGDANDHADHALSNHDHSVAAHSHTGPSHDHSIGAHTHTGPEHNHTTPNHSHGIADHTHTFTGDAIALAAHTHITAAGDSQTIDEFTDLQVGAIRESPVPTMTATGTNADNGPGATANEGSDATGLGGTGATGSSSGTTGAGGTGATSEQSAVTTGSAGSATLTHSETDNRPQFYVLAFIMKS